MKKVIIILTAILIFLIIITILISNFLKGTTKPPNKESITSVPYNSSSNIIINNTNSKSGTDNNNGNNTLTNGSQTSSEGNKLSTTNLTNSSISTNSTGTTSSTNSTNATQYDINSLQGGDLASEEELLKNSTSNQVNSASKISNLNQTSDENIKAGQYLANFLNSVLPSSTTPKSLQQELLTSAKTYNGLVYYPQCGGAYDNYPLPSGGTICNAGCGPTSVAMLLSSFIDNKYTPSYVVDLYKENNQPLSGMGSSPASARTILTKYGLTLTDPITLYDRGENEVVSDFKKYLDEGWVLFVLAHYGKTDKGYTKGHFFVVSGVENGQIMAFDPYYGSGKELPFRENVYDPFPKYAYAFGVKK